MSPSATLYALAIALFALFLGLGFLVTRLSLGRIDASAIALRGYATRLALFLTYTGRGPFLTGAFVLAIGAFAVFHKPLWIPTVLAGSQLVTQGMANFFKATYGRTRPDYWLVGLEAGHAYPSGHAVTAVVFYVGWAIVAGFSPFALPVREALAALLIVWAAGVSWSRLALGAHYVTDVLGGTLLGFAWLCALVGVFDQVLVAR